jgi:putative RecB family exonuclease
MDQRQGGILMAMKLLNCIACGKEEEASKFASSKSFKCGDCKKSKKKPEKKPEQEAKPTTAKPKPEAKEEATATGVIYTSKAMEAKLREHHGLTEADPVIVVDDLPESLGGPQEVPAFNHEANFTAAHSAAYGMSGWGNIGETPRYGDKVTVVDPQLGHKIETTVMGPAVGGGWNLANTQYKTDAAPTDAPIHTQQAREYFMQNHMPELSSQEVDNIKRQSAVVENEESPKQNSMRANRDAKASTHVKPFIPEPYFLRQSMISSYLQCPDKMYDSYENGYNEDTIFTKVGTAIHGVMEDYYAAQLTTGAAVAAISTEELFDRWWTEHAISDWDWYEDWRGFVVDYFNRQTEKPNVIALELEFRTSINGVPFSGTIDRIDRVDDKTIRIVDYKTNFMPFSAGDLEESVQFRSYDLAVRTNEVRELLRKNGDTGEFDTVLCTYEMLRLGYQQHTTFTRESQTIFADWLKMIWNKILSGVDRSPQLNKYCAFCQKRESCPVYIKVLEDAKQGKPVEIYTEATDHEALDAEREALAHYAKIVKKRQEEIDAQIKMLISQNNGAIVIGGAEYTTKSSTRYNYPTSDVIRILALNGKSDLMGSILNVGTTNMKKTLDKDTLALIEEIKVAQYTAPSLSRKKVK